MRESVIIAAARTPTGKFLGSLKDFTAPELGAIAVREAVRRAGIDPGRRRRMHHGQRRVRRRGTESRAPGGAQRRPARARRRDDHQQGLRIRPESRDARGTGDRGRRHRHRRRRRHGVDEQHAVSPAARPRRAAHGQRDDRRRDDPGRPVVRLRPVPHGDVGRARRRHLQGRPRRSGRSTPPRAIARRPHATREGWFKDEIVPVEIPQKKGPADQLRSRRSDPRRHDARDAGGPEAGVQEGWQRHGRQRPRRERRRRGAGGHGRRHARRRSASRRWRASSARRPAASRPSWC